MIVKLKNKAISENLILKYCNELSKDREIHLDLDADYLVICLYINNNGSVLAFCLNKYEHIAEYPLDLFEIKDNSVSSYWLMKFKENGDITFFPKEFYDNEYFLDDLSEDDPKTVLQFHDLINRLKAEQKFT